MGTGYGHQTVREIGERPLQTGVAHLYFSLREALCLVDLGAVNMHTCAKVCPC